MCDGVDWMAVEGYSEHSTAPDLYKNRFLDYLRDYELVKKGCVLYTRSYEHAPESCWEVSLNSALQVVKFANLMAVLGVRMRAAASGSASASVLKSGCSN